ncbi:PAS domain S-box-containing protein/diguanylate cyclase (GGDEF)-like protein [Salsuginibacillus halophilus]|uniref:PAS domain S-box-containing protein/diguanylate cyclase (GGDEF)-like protein n=1 Tax=Salsuginibacillus halophilus TaxID=517424 RepID=A0A2P8H967_9BACI|nr:EAL domain-containing protein [Salsuginibacillus halophilus]PSL42730.1 PAS domain S-box-containing protein/diguanylate cyclase (GGDEF)-like protein [Salsuginibacillus halophilus]
MNSFQSYQADFSENRSLHTHLLTQIYEAMSSTSDQNETFFETMVERLASVLDVNAAFIGEFIQPQIVETKAFIFDGTWIDNIHYHITDTPCEHVKKEHQVCCYPQNVQQLFPKDEELAGVNAEAYLGAPLTDSQGEVIGIIVILNQTALTQKELAQTILGILSTHASHELERIRHKRALQQSEAKYKQLVENSPDGIAMLQNDRIEYINEQGRVNLGFEQPGSLPGNFTALFPPEEQRRLRDELKAVEAGVKETTALDISYLTPDENKRNFYLKALYCELNEEPVVQIIIRDMTEQTMNEATIRYMAYYDALTDLPNRYYLYERGNELLDQAHTQDERVAVFLIDIHRFSHINHNFGHETGDTLLRAVGDRLRQFAKFGDLTVRWSGEEFLFIHPIQTPEETNVELGDQLIQLFEEPIRVSGLELHVPVRIGVSVYPVHGKDFSTLVNNADTALHHKDANAAKELTWYEPYMNHQTNEMIALESSLRSALQSNEFELHYQPQRDLATGEITGAEALLRWNHPVFGMVPPKDFIPIAESSGMIVPIGTWVLEQACADMNNLIEAGMRNISLSVNMSPRQFYQEDFIQSVQQLLERKQTPGCSINIEITEGMAMDFTVQNIERLEVLRELGLGLFIDDFGIGYSSLSYMSTLPFDGLKIDRSFVSRMLHNSADAKIIKSMIDLAHNLEMSVVAEGVETEAQYNYLRELGCDTMQGFLLAKPMPIEDFKTSFNQ